ncbi:MAG: fasciclin domain-containing protein [Brevundimonas sp.]|uniref:fasciclin domain-containing protein n=1 Tax=Brevundimonas sp. TaxID=1871086 RepID=UPI004034B4DD
MLRTRLLTAAAAVALMAAPAAFAQDMPGQSPVTPLPTEPAPTPPATTDTSATTPAPATAPAQATAATPAAGSTVIDTLKAQGQFTTLLTALDAAQLTDTLKAQPAVSIFAPTDAAFAALPEAERTRLMDPANVNELRQTLLYHVIVADVNSSQIKGTKGGVETAARSQVQLDGTGASIKVDDATVVTADIDASNGAVFAIDKVLSPAASAVASGDAEEATTEEAPAAAPAPATSPDPAAAPAPTPPVAPTEPAAEPTDDTPETPVTPPTPQ